MTYSDKLKDPRWQKKRLEIMERDEFTCRHCGNNENTLMVHHYKYTGNPWEADNKDLVTLCENCHGREHHDLIEAKKELNRIMTGKPALSLWMVAHFLRQMESSNLGENYLRRRIEELEKGEII